MLDAGQRSGETVHRLEARAAANERGMRPGRGAEKGWATWPWFCTAHVRQTLEPTLRDASELFRALTTVAPTTSPLPFASICKK